MLTLASCMLTRSDDVWSDIIPVISGNYVSAAFSSAHEDKHTCYTGVYRLDSL